MFLSSEANELKNQYESGQRNFQKIQLRRADLRGLDLSHADLRGADLSYSNLRDVNLSGANLSEVYLDEADLSGANLQGTNLQNASLIKAYLMKTNLENANLSQAYLTGAYLTKAIAINANLAGAYLKGSKLAGADLTGAYYDSKTHFDAGFNVGKLGMKKDHSPPIATPTQEKERKITTADLLHTFNHLSQIGARYLGGSTTAKYWQAARPDDDALKGFEIMRGAEFAFTGESQEEVSKEQLQAVQTWVHKFIGSCSHIIQNFTAMVDSKQCVIAIASPPIPTKTVVSPTSQPRLDTQDFKIKAPSVLISNPVK